ncbi:hypothetical protein [Alicyclobacillus tolerans]|uniref:hypothetical protein n=1 Tax=Alicyclobacillus tolerans TaxID=90970 RepID=UPI00101AD8FE|nr:hypothetical protein [Alicyclobacillus montanus]
MNYNRKYTIAGLSVTLFILCGCGNTPASNSNATNKVAGITVNSSRSLGSGLSSDNGNDLSTYLTINVQNT